MKNLKDLKKSLFNKIEIMLEDMEYDLSVREKKKHLPWIGLVLSIITSVLTNIIIILFSKR